jgi:serine/threonine protein kinase
MHWFCLADYEFGRSNLDHPNLLTYFGLAVDTNRAMIVMERADKSLEQAIADRDLHNPMEVAVSIAKGLHFLHSRKIVHRDISLRNLLVSLSVYAFVV